MIQGEYFYRLISLPLFQGLTREDALDIAGKARFDFRRAQDGERIVAEGSECRELIFIIAGTLRYSERSTDGSYTLEEFGQAPTVIQPERLFGRRPRYTRDVYAHESEVQYLVVSKSDVRDILFTYMPFHLNYLNYICSCQQVLLQRLQMPEPMTLRQQFIAFLQRRCDHMAGPKRLIVGMNELGTALHATRLNVSRLLHELEDEGLVTLQRGLIEIPAAEQLFKGFS